MEVFLLSQSQPNIRLIKIHFSDMFFHQQCDFLGILSNCDYKFVCQWKFQIKKVLH